MSVRVAVIGVGYLGQQHARIYSELKDAELICVVDKDRDKAAEVAYRFGCRADTDYTSIIKDVDAVSIVVPTSLHHRIAMDFLRHNIDILVEKPITSTVKEAGELIAEAKKKGLILQVGHLERFNAGVSLLARAINEPRCIEAKRLSPC